MNSSNPALRSSVFSDVSFGQGAGALEGSSFMTLQGTIAKTAMLLLVVTAAAAFSWQKMSSGFTVEGGNPNGVVWIFGGLIGGLILALVISFKPKLAPVLAVPYAAFEGLFLGAVSAIYAGAYAPTTTAVTDSIVLQAVLLTFATAFSMLGLYAFRIIRVTERLRSIVMAATGGIFIFYMISFALSFFGIQVPFLHSGGPIGIAISLAIVGVAAFNLLLDFDLIERGSKGGAPKYMEWYGAFALLVTLVWLYLEMLRLLSKLRSSD